MIQSKILGEAAGIQYQGVKDESEINQTSSLTTGYFVGRFKRGFMGKPFTVTATNFQALLGYDPSNPDYLAVEDVFNRGVPSLQVLRVGSPTGKVTAPGNGGSTGGTGGDTDNSQLPSNPYVVIRNRKLSDSWNPFGFNGIAIINGQQFTLGDGGSTNNGVTYYSTSNGTVYFEPSQPGVTYDVLLKFTQDEWQYNGEILEGDGIVDEVNHTIQFKLLST